MSNIGDHGSGTFRDLARPWGVPAGARTPIEMAELERINFHHICFIPDSYLSGFSDERCKSGQDNRAHHCEIEEAAKPGGEEEMLN